MAKQKIVIKVTLANTKSRSHALVLAAKTNGITGDDKPEVVGDGVDITCLVNLLRKKLCCHAEITQVEPVKGDKKPEEKKKPEEEPKPCLCPPPCRWAGSYDAPQPTFFFEDDPQAGVCHIM